MAALAATAEDPGSIPRTGIVAKTVCNSNAKGSGIHFRPLQVPGTLVAWCSVCSECMCGMCLGVLVGGYCCLTLCYEPTPI